SASIPSGIMIHAISDNTATATIFIWVCTVIHAESLPACDMTQLSRSQQYTPFISLSIPAFPVTIVAPSLAASSAVFILSLQKSLSQSAHGGRRFLLEFFHLGCQIPYPLAELEYAVRLIGIASDDIFSQGSAAWCAT